MEEDGAAEHHLLVSLVLQREVPGDRMPSKPISFFSSQV